MSGLGAIVEETKTRLGDTLPPLIQMSILVLVESLVIGHSLQSVGFLLLLCLLILHLYLVV